MLIERPLFALLLLSTSACGDDTSSSGGAGGGAIGGAGSGAGSIGGAGTGAGSQVGGESSGGSAPTETVHFVGRFDDQGASGQVSSWSGSTLVTTISGTGLDVTLDGPSGVWFRVVVDGAETKTFKLDGATTSWELAAGLPAGEHEVRLVRRNEGFFGDVAFAGFTPKDGGSLIATPSPFAHSIEFIGDSITCGYGVEGADANCNFSGATEDVTKTYAAIAAANTQAAAHFIAYSGKGVHQNYGGDMTEPMPELYLRTLTNDPAKAWDFGRFVPEAVVVNLGTNDFSAALDDAAFVADYAALLATVRGFRPDATIITVTWAHWGAGNEALVHDAVTQFADPKVIETRFEIKASEGFGCDYHPSVATHARLGQELTTLLQTQLGW